jgi:hypothetical protein
MMDITMPVTTRDVPWEVIAEEQLAVSTAVVRITPALLVDPVKTIARISVSGGAVRARMLADPTAAIGAVLPANSMFEVVGPNDLRRIGFIRESVDATIFVQLGRQ